MNYLISTEYEYDLDGFKTVSSLESIALADKESVLVIHTFEEESFKGGMVLTDLYNSLGVFKLIYVNENPLVNIRAVVESLNGVVETDETLLEDPDEILGLVDLIEEESLVAIENKLVTFNTGFDVMTDFLTQIENNSDKLRDPLYVEMVDRSVQEIRNTVTEQESRVDLIGKGVIETYKNTMEVVDHLKEEAERLKIQIEEIESTQGKKVGVVEALNFYPPITYTGTTPVVVFKEISACRYLSSYVLAYANHLKTVRNKRVRVVFVVGKQSLIQRKYKEFFELTRGSYKTSKAILSEVSYTTTPFKDLMMHTTRQTDDIIIIVDRTYEKDPIMKGKARVFYGVSSLSEIKREKLEVKDCIMSVRRIKDSLATIQHIENFPSGVDNRLDRYERKYHEDFNRIDSLLGMDRVTTR